MARSVWEKRKNIATFNSIIKYGTAYMAITPQFIDERFNPLIKNVLKKIVKNWSKSFQATLAQFRESTQNLQGVLNNLAVDDISPFQFRSQLEKTFNEYLGWTTDLNFASDNIFSNQFLETWDSEFKQSLEELPKKMNITIKDVFWETQKEDSLKIHLWKWKKRRQIGLKKFRLKVRNKTRAIFKKSQIPIPKISRKFSLHDFLTYYLNQPYIDFLLQEWQRFLQLAANQLYQCHTQSEAIKNNSLFHGESIASCLTPDSGELLAQIEKIKQQIIDLIQLFDDTDQFNEQAIIRLESAWSEIVNGIEQKWEPAGTLALSSRRFGSKKIESNKNRLHKKFENIKDSWLKHFFGEKEEWQKDIELSLIQLQTSRICNDTILEVEKKISLDIVPLFAETGELIASHLNQFKLISPDKKSEIRKAIATENRLLVEKLRREKLPVILDALLEAGFDSVLKNYLDQTRKGLEIFSERHLIFRNRDMENLTPKSTTVEVPFRLLILEEIFPSLQTAHETLTGETHRQMQELLRDVSEIDQIVEYNLETALNLL
ncbi:MAG TPA: hypothetical protein VGD14_02355, partial [bacterium]